MQLHHSTGDITKGEGAQGIPPVNLAAVWGQMSTGGGHSKLQETMCVLGVPVMSARHFINTEREIGESW